MRTVRFLLAGLVIVTLALFTIVSLDSGALKGIDVFLTAEAPSMSTPIWASVGLGLCGQLLVPAVAGAAVGYSYQVSSQATADERRFQLVARLSSEVKTLEGEDLMFELEEIRQQHGQGIAQQVRDVVESDFPERR